MIIDGKLVISKKKKSVLIAELQKLGFKSFAKVEDASKAGELERAIQGEEDEDNEPNVAAAASSYDYLLGVSQSLLISDLVTNEYRWPFGLLLKSGSTNS